MMPRYAGTSTPVTAASGWDSGQQQSGFADRVKGIVFSDKAGNLFIDQSIDNGTNWDLVKTIAVTANTGLAFSEELVGNAYRVRFTPATDTTVFRIAVNTSSAGPR